MRSAVAARPVGQLSTGRPAARTVPRPDPPETLGLGVPRVTAERGSAWTDPFTSAHSARVDNVLLGGSYHWAVDRKLATALTAAVPGIRDMVWHNRMFQRRAVEYLLAAGIRQFIDLGCGIPTLDAVHQIAHYAQPDAKVVYVDNDPVTAELGRTLLADQPRTLVVEADLRDPHRILGHPDVNNLLDLGEPVAVLALAVLHHIPDCQTLTDLVTAWRDCTVTGSHLVISHFCHDQQPAAMTALTRTTGRAGILTVPRSRRQIRQLFHGWNLVAPGLTWTAAWRPEPGSNTERIGHPRRAGLLAGVACKKRRCRPPDSVTDLGPARVRPPNRGRTELPPGTFVLPEVAG